MRSNKYSHEFVCAGPFLGRVFYLGVLVKRLKLTAMSVIKRCQQCGEVFTARRSDAKFCGSRCRQRNFQGLLHQPAASVSEPAGLPPDRVADADLAATVEQQLRDAGQVDTIDGKLALGVAAHLCRSISGAERAALVKSLHEVMSRAFNAADDALDPVEAIKARAWAIRHKVMAEDDPAPVVGGRSMVRRMALIAN